MLVLGGGWEMSRSWISDHVEEEEEEEEEER